MTINNLEGNDAETNKIILIDKARMSRYKCISMSESKYSDFR